MIKKSEIMDFAKSQLLLPNVIEKDYVLGWILAGISANPEFKENWIFKGGTCLKKCHIETHRFSEDLDFTLREPKHLDSEFLIESFSKITYWIYDRSGIEFPLENIHFEVFRNPRGFLICEGKIGYQGPISPKKTKRNLPRVKLDLTAEECLVVPPMRMPVIHPYSDLDEAEFNILSYAFEEVFGEKVRALGDRVRPRDLYDVINLYRREKLSTKVSIIRDIVQKKCAFKAIPLPSLETVLSRRNELEATWEPMLGHQLPNLPTLETFLEMLPGFFRWLSLDK